MMALTAALRGAGVREAMATTSSLPGRDAEAGHLRKLVDELEYRGFALLLHGEPGIGKSSLLEVARARAAQRGVRVVPAAGVAAETDLPYAALHRLLRPLLPRAGAIPAVLPAAFGGAGRPDPFLVGSATLEVLSGLARAAPMLILVDDGHLLDPASLDALAFVARRLDDEPIGILVAGRSGAVGSRRLERAGFRQRRIGALPEPVAAELLRDAHPDAPAAVRAEWQRQAAGNPLVLRELPLGQQLDGALAAGPAPAVTPTLVRHFAAQLFGLPAATQTMLVVLAADESTALPELLRAGARVLGRPVEQSALSPALDAELILLDAGGPAFRHPLVRAATYRYASPSELLRVHRALAEVSTHDPARNAWHAAATLTGPNGSAANSLAAAAHVAYRRGMLAAAVRRLARSAELTVDPARRGTRLLDAAELAAQLGEHGSVLRLAGAATGCALRPVDRHRLRWIGLADQRAPAPAEVARDAARWARRTLEQGEYLLGFHLLRQAAERGAWVRPAEDLRDLILAAAEPLPDSERIAIEALAAPATGAGALARLLAGRPDRGDPDDRAAPVGGDQPALLGLAAARTGQFSRAVPLLNEAGYLFRAQGRLGRLAGILVEHAWAQIHLGQYAAAHESAVEGVRLAEQTAQPLWASAGRLVVAAVRGIRGDTEAALALTAGVEIEASAHRVGGLLARAQAVRGLTLLAAARHEPALDALLRLFDPADAAYDPLLGCWMFGDLAETATQLGRAAEARALLPAVEELAERTDGTRARAAVGHARALLAGDASAEPHFQRALADDRSAEPFTRARLQLAYGEWLRRRRRVAASRLPLSAALTGFQALRLPAWTDRAQREARVAGLRVGASPAAAPALLTPADLEIAQLASGGLSNRQIGAQLYLSHRTVAAHLYRIFPKLGITSRAQLHAALAELGAVESSAAG
jgi:DNA-binding CsgD family transcriptional regulator